MVNKLNILHVDDSAATTLYAKIILLTVPIINKAETAHTIKQAKTLLRRQKFDFVILETFFPDGNGIELLKWIKRNYPTIIVIVFTNDSDPYLRSEAKKSSAEHFLDKSTGFETIIHLLKKHNSSTINYSGTKIKNIAC